MLFSWVSFFAFFWFVGDVGGVLLETVLLFLGGGLLSVSEGRFPIGEVARAPFRQVQSATTSIYFCFCFPFVLVSSFGICWLILSRIGVSSVFHNAAVPSDPAKTQRN